MNCQDAIDTAQQREFGDLTWDTFSDSFEDSLQRLEEIVDDVSDLRQVCRDEWCEATECLLGGGHRRGVCDQRTSPGVQGGFEKTSGPEEKDL